MKVNILWASLSFAILAGAIWLKNPHRQANENLTLKKQVSVTTNTSKQTDHSKNEIFSRPIKTNNNSRKEVKKIDNQSQVLTEEISMDNEKGTDTPQEVTELFEDSNIFTGNSEYTGDDTEDNDAGNAGFEDDFPEAAFAYDNHAAEGYNNYTESYKD